MERCSASPVTKGMQINMTELCMQIKMHANAHAFQNSCHQEKVNTGGYEDNVSPMHC